VGTSFRTGPQINAKAVRIWGTTIRGYHFSDRLDSPRLLCQVSFSHAGIVGVDLFS
jgi:hypothetical protein